MCHHHNNEDDAIARTTMFIAGHVSAPHVGGQRYQNRVEGGTTGLSHALHVELRAFNIKVAAVPLQEASWP
jgi:hypothetical protein